MPPALIWSGPSSGVALGGAGVERRRPRPSRARSGMNRIGSQPSASSAVISTFLSPSEATQIGIGVALGVDEDLQRLAEAEALVLRQRDVEDAVDCQRLALEARSRTIRMTSRVRPERLVVGQPVEPLDHLRPGGAETEHRPAAGDVVEAGRGLQDRAGGAREDVEDAGGDLEPLGLGGQVAHQRGRVEAVGLGHPDHVEPGLLELGDLVGGRRGGCRRTGGESRAAPPNCDSDTVTVQCRSRERWVRTRVHGDSRRCPTASLSRTVASHRSAGRPTRRSSAACAARCRARPEVGGVLGGDVVGVAVAQRAADDDRALALVAEPRRRVDDLDARGAGRVDGHVAEHGGPLDRLEHAVAEARAARGQAGGGVVGRLGYVADQHHLVGGWLELEEQVVVARAQQRDDPVDGRDPLAAVEDAVDRRRRRDHDQVGVEVASTCVDHPVLEVGAVGERLVGLERGDRDVRGGALRLDEVVGRPVAGLDDPV